MGSLFVRSTRNVDEDSTSHTQSDARVRRLAALARVLLAPYVEMVDDLERSARRATKKAAAPADPAAPTG